MTTEYTHTPVLCEESLEFLSPQAGSIVVDATVGRMGHGKLLAQAVMKGGGTYIGIDLDVEALELGNQVLSEIREELGEGEYILLQGSFGDMDALLHEAEVGYVDTFFLDIGVSSPQIDNPDRGFSFKQNALLDMRFDQGAGIPTASELLASLGHYELTQILQKYGEEKWASRIATFIVEAREKEAIETSSQLVEIIKAAIPASARRAGGHPAKRTFQALRIAVNDELDALERGLEAVIRWLRPGGRVGVLTFHSLEDRIVKKAFASAGKQGCDCPANLPVCMCEDKAVLRVLTKRPIQPTEQEIESNARARSTKLRVAEKL